MSDLPGGRPGRAALGALVALVVLAAFLAFVPRLVARGSVNPLTNPVDFRAFYCGARAVARGADPYRVQPMWGCQGRAAASEGLQIDGRHVLPAPLPPYALVVLAALAPLPFANAAALWFALTVAFVIATAIVLQRVTRLAPRWVVLALLVSDLFASIVIGQIVPLVLCALVAS
ncbi:MAG: hypothetical protein ACREM2_10630, partial [Vulcanimicrobiaceae bacterium]